MADLVSTFPKMTPRLGSLITKLSRYQNTGQPQKAMRNVPAHVQKPFYADLGIKAVFPEGTLTIKNRQEVDVMRRSCAIAKDTLDYVAGLITPGVKTCELDELCHEFIVSRDAYPSPLSYMGFPASICTSVNDVLCHGIPGDYSLKDGDIISVDVTVYTDGYHGDSCRTFIVGTNNDVEHVRLVETAYETTMEGIKHCRAGNSLYNVGKAMGSLAKSCGYQISRDFCGHGIGKHFHELPYVYHYKSSNNNLILKPGMVFTIEPILCQRSAKSKLWNDGWTYSTIDKGLAAQFEHTIHITPDGNPEILT